MTGSNRLANLRVKGLHIEAAIMKAVFDSLPCSFVKADFSKALVNAGISEATDMELVRQVMQLLK